MLIGTKELIIAAPVREPELPLAATATTMGHFVSVVRLVNNASSLLTSPRDPQVCVKSILRIYLMS